MKGIILALLATVAGLLMVGGGVAGLIFTGDDDSGGGSATASTTTLPTFPTTTATAPGAADLCLQARGRDLRLGLLELVDLQPNGRESGRAEINAVCAGRTVTMFIRLEGMREKDTSSYFVYLYKSRRRAEQIGSLIGSDGNASGSATIDEDVNTKRYDRIVITRVEFGVGEKRPRRIVFSGSI